MESPERSGFETITSRGALGVADVRDKTREHRLRWFGYVMRRVEDCSVRAMEGLRVGVKRGSGKPKPIWELVI